MIKMIRIIIFLLTIVSFSAKATWKDSAAVYSKNAMPFNVQDKFLDKIYAVVDPGTDEEIGKAMGAFQKMEASGKWTQTINPNELTEFPIGLKENLSSVEYGLVVTKAKFTPEYAIINVYARVITPMAGDKDGKRTLYFGAEGIKLSYKGRIVGDARLSLLGDVNIPFNAKKWLLTLKGGKIARDGNSVSDTYVSIDCDGIKELSLNGEVQISREVVLPLNEDGKPLPELASNGKTNRVRGAFAVKASDWNDLLMKVDLTPFAITKQVQNENKGYFSFLVNIAVLDLSDLRNDPSVIFPSYYAQNGLLIAGEQSWRGLFIQSLEVGLPEEFKSTKQNANKPLTLSARNLIIDNYGVSGMFAADNIMPLDEGKTSEKGGWAYSLDHIGVDLAASKIVGASLAGKIQLPIQRKENQELNGQSQNGSLSYLGFKGIMTDDEYLVNVSIESDIDFDIFRAKAKIQKGSYVELYVKDREFMPRAVLSGRMDINPIRKSDDSNNDKTSLKGIEFQELAIQTKGPYLTVKYFGMKGEHKLANFPISINDIALSVSESNAELQMGIKITLMDGGFAAGGVIGVQGDIKNDNGRQQWGFKKFNIAGISLDNVDIGIAKVSGSLQLMDNDPLYGDGFQAKLKADITSLGIKVQVQAAFGRSTFRYWGFDGIADGLNASIGYININGFTGGAFYRMIPDGERSILAKDRAFVFKPDEKVGMSLRAGVFGSFIKKGTIDFMAQFNIDTNPGGGLKYIGFRGEAVVMKQMSDVFPNPLEKVQDKFSTMVKDSKFIKDISNNERLQGVLDNVEVLKKNDGTYLENKSEFAKAFIYARLSVGYDFNNKTLHGALDAYLNTPGNFLSGIGDNGRAGWAVLHIAPNEKYLHIGTPQDMIGIRAGIGSFSLKVGSYFMVGDKIPASPPPPQQVADILGVELNNLDYMKDLNTLSEGRGFAFGAHLSFDTGDMTALFLYARFAAGVGSDIMLRNYGEAKCSNRGGDGIGINGWYANGQAYVYLQGELGIKIKLFFIRKKIPIIKAGVAALLQMKGPNPFWMRGYLGGYYDLLGGLVKGRFRFKMEFGEECKLDNGNVLGGMKIISDMTPTKDESGVDVFAIPQATFAFKVNDAFVLPEDDGDHTYKILVDKFTVVDDAGREIKGKVEYAKAADVANFVSEDILPPSKKLKAIVQVSFQEKKNGIFETLMVDGKKATETEEREFTTGTAPTIIPLSNIQYAYPVVGQENYYKDETNKGYIKLKRGQDYLFEDPNWKTITRIVDKDGKAVESDFSYNTSDNEVSFKIPNLKNESQYTLGIAAKTANASSSSSTSNSTGESNTQSSGSYSNDDNMDTTVSYAQKEAQKVSKDGEIERLAFTFRSSKYNTFKAKINSLSFTNLWMKVSSDVVTLQNNMNASEYFDITELQGSEYSDNKPLIVLTAKMEDSFANKFKQLIYDAYPIDEMILDRDTDDAEIKIPPTNALPIFTSYISYLGNQKSDPFLKRTFPYQYDLFRYYKLDWYEMATKAASKYIDTPSGRIPSAVRAIMESSFNIIPNGKYKVEAQYILPGNKAGTNTDVNYEFK